MSLTTFSTNVKVINSHVRVIITPEIVESSWAQISGLGDQIVDEVSRIKRPSCLVDLTQLDFMGSALVALIVRVWKEIRNQNGTLVVVTDNTIVKETISLAGLNKLWNIQPTIDAGCRVLDIDSAQQAELDGKTVVFEKSGLGKYERLVWIGVVIALILVLMLSIYAIDFLT